MAIAAMSCWPCSPADPRPDVFGYIYTETACIYPAASAYTVDTGVLYSGYYVQ